MSGETADLELLRLRRQLVEAVERALTECKLPAGIVPKEVPWWATGWADCAEAVRAAMTADPSPPVSSVLPVGQVNP